MAIQQTATTSFKVEALQAIHNFGPTSPNTFKCALFTSAASIGAGTTSYSEGMGGEVSSSGTNYTTGGNVLTISQYPTSANNLSGVPTAFVSFQNTSWPNANFTVRGALIYNYSQSNRSVAVLNFSSDITINGDTFTIIFPTPNANDAIVRIS